MSTMSSHKGDRCTNLGANFLLLLHPAYASKLAQLAAQVGALPLLAQLAAQGNYVPRDFWGNAPLKALAGKNF